MARTPALLLALLALLPAACRDDGGEQAGPEPPADSVTEGDALTPARLTGIWTRPVPPGGGRGEGSEGIHLRPDGSLGLIGVPDLAGIDWRIEGDALLVRMNTERYPEPYEERYRIVELTDERLVLEADAGYLVGSFTRAETGQTAEPDTAG